MEDYSTTNDGLLLNHERFQLRPFWQSNYAHKLFNIPPDVVHVKNEVRKLCETLFAAQFSTTKFLQLFPPKVQRKHILSMDLEEKGRYIKKIAYLGQAYQVALEKLDWTTKQGGVNDQATTWGDCCKISSQPVGIVFNDSTYYRTIEIWNASFLIDKCIMKQSPASEDGSEWSYCGRK